MEELVMAKHMMDKFEKANEGNVLTGPETLAVIQAYAAIAQADLLKRIADALQGATDPNYGGTRTIGEQLVTITDLLR